MGGVDFFGKSIGPMQMTRLIGAKSWLRGLSFAIPTLDRRLDASTNRLDFPRCKRASFLMGFFPRNVCLGFKFFKTSLGLALL